MVIHCRRRSILLFAAAILATLLFGLGCRKQGSVIIEETTNLYQRPTWPDTTNNTVIAVLKKDEKGQILAIEYSKDFKYYKVRFDDGRVGYVIYGDKFRVVQ